MIAHNFYRIPGGEDRYVGAVAELLQGRGIQTSVLDFHSAETSRVKTGALMMAQGSRRSVAKRISDLRPDVVHLNNPYPGIGPRGVQELASVAPVVMTLHNYRLRCPNGLFFTKDEQCERCTRWGTLPAARFNCLGSPVQSLVYAIGLGLERLIKPIEDSVSLFLAPSRFLQQKMIDFGLPTERVRYLPYPYEGDVPESVDPGDVMLFVGRLSREKGAHLVVDAARLGGWPTTIVGDGPERGELEAFAPHNVSFTGWLPESKVAELMGRARALVIPSLWYENLPFVLLTGMAHGRAIVSGAWGSVGSLVREHQAGRTFDDDSAEALAGEVTQIWEQTDLLRQWGANGQAFVRTELAPERHLSHLTEIYREAATPAS